MTLLLFDLNGFKRYNDTFGHPAGDAMLTRLGGQLRAAVASDGTAYRVGGDEFAVLIECAPERQDAVIRRVAEALTISGPGFEVGASWDAVTIPAEASTSAAAMELADVRMYAQKESRRIASDDGIEIDVGNVEARLQRPGDGEALEHREQNGGDLRPARRLL